jgi:hypothetical protein
MALPWVNGYRRGTCGVWVDRRERVMFMGYSAKRVLTVKP